MFKTSIELTRIGQILQNMPCYRYNNTMHSCIIDEEKHIICLKALFRRFCCNPLIVLATTLYTTMYDFNISLLEVLGFATIIKN